MVIKSAQNKLPAASRQVSLLKNSHFYKIKKFTRTDRETLRFVTMVEDNDVPLLINASSITTIFNIVPSQAGIQQSVLFHLAVFQVIPLSFIGMLEISKKVSSVYTVVV